MKLTEKQIRFCKEYIIDYNGTQSAIRATYSEKGVERTAANILRLTKIQDFIKELEQDKEKANKVTVEKVLTELSKIAFSNVTDYIEVKKESITLTDWTQLTKEQTACIESVQEIAQGYKVKLYNKPHALELIGKHLGMFTETIDQLDIDIPKDIDSLSPKEVDEYYNRLTAK